MGGTSYHPVKQGGSDRLGTHSLKAGDEVYFPGIDMESKLHVLANNPGTRTIAIKASGGTHWTGNHMPRAYHSPRVLILNYDGACILEWEIKKTKKEAHGGKN